MVLEALSDSCDVCHCTRLFRNAFKIKGTPEAAVKRPISTSARKRRLIGMASGRTSSPDLGSPCPKSQNHECAAIFSPDGQNSTPHKFGGFKSSKPRFPLEEFDPNSQDSGYGGGSQGSFDEKHHSSNFQFAEPLGVAPRRLSLEGRSPLKSPVRSSPQRKRPARPALFRSLSSGYESTDDGFNDLIDMESLESDESRLPKGLSSLISGDIVAEKPMDLDLVSTTPEGFVGRPMFGLRRSLSAQCARLEDAVAEEYSPPSASKVRSCLFRSPNASCSTAKLGFDEQPRAGREVHEAGTLAIGRKFKRPEPPLDEHSPVLVKRSRKCTSFQDVSLARDEADGCCSPPPLLQRSHSENEAHAHIKSAIHRSTTDSDLTGDFSKQCVLPLESATHHEDLKSISCATLARLIQGEFKDLVSDYKIVDCRYPYEYEAGHIEGALNLYSKEMIEKALLDPLQHAPAIEPDTHKRSILVFHCEFSWERGPNLSRFLRNVDRQRNKEHYPALHYPEIYLLHGGYKDFFEAQRTHCLPQGYRAMKHPDHEADLRQFRSKSKSWQGEKTSRANVVTARANLKRLGF